MKIVFALPTISFTPAGGYKVVYEYANRLVKDGYEVEIIYSLLVDNRCFLSSIKKILYILLKYLQGHRNACWMEMDPRVKHTKVLSFKAKLPEADVYIATSAQTAQPISMNKNIPIFAKRLYFIQGYENWEMSEEQLHATYLFPNLKNVCIANWLKNKVETVGGTAIVVPNGFNPNNFYLRIPIEQKRPFRICMLYHKGLGKACGDAMQAVKMAKQTIKEIELVMFGVPEKPAGLPEWVTYHQQPPKELLRRIYDESAIYVAASVNEGWGLTLGEAAMCGCAIVCTDIGGYREMFIPDETALMSPVHTPQAMADNIIRLCLNKEKRIRLANQSWKSIQQFSFENSYQKLLGVICG